MFDVAIYTDTRASEAIDGIDGFNFQAVSDGITAQDRQAIRDYLLHRVVTGWSVDHDPLDHPPSFVYHRHGDRYYLARGISTGVTNNGRPGNLLTQAIMTMDADDFVSISPAQLFGAVNWKLEKAPSKHLDQWATPLEVATAFTSEALCQMVKDDQWATAHLADYLSMIEQVTDEDPKRLIVITSDEVLAQRWIALGTLFVDAQKALGLDIRGLVPDPMTTRADIVAASPDFGPQPDPMVARAGVNIVDIDRKLIGPVQRSESAITQAEWFLHEESGTALAAIALARKWEQYLGRDLATKAAAVACFSYTRADHNTWCIAMSAINGLAINGQADELLFYGDELLDAAITFAFTDPKDAALCAEVLCSLIKAGCDDLAVGVLMPALEAVLGVPHLRDAWLGVVAVTAGSPRLQWSDDEARQQASDQMSDVVATVEDTELPTLMAALRILDIPLSGVAQGQAIAHLANLWASRPALYSQCQLWAYASEITNQLVRLLLARWQSGDRASLASLGSGAWDWLTTRAVVSPGDRQMISGWSSAAKVSKVHVTRRADALYTAGQLPPESWVLVWAGVTLPIGCDLLTAWAETQRVVTSGAGLLLVGQINNLLNTTKVATAVRDLLVRLNQPDIDVQSPELAQMAAKMAQAEAVFIAALKSQGVPNPYMRSVISYAPQMITLMCDYLGDLMLDCPDESGVVNLAKVCDGWVEYSVHEAMNRRCDTEERISDAITKALALEDSKIESMAAAAKAFLIEVSDDRSKSGMVNQAAKHKAIDKDIFAEFEDFVKDNKKGRFGRRLTRAANDMLGEGN